MLVYTDQDTDQEDKGFVLKSVLVLLTIALLLISGVSSTKVVKIRQMKIKRIAQMQIRNEAFENSSAKVITWLKQNSSNFVTPFLASNFSKHFQSSSTLVGDNDALIRAKTLVKKRGTKNSVIISNNYKLGRSNFPITSLVRSFEKQDFGDLDARLTLLKLLPSGKDRKPVFRLDLFDQQSDLKAQYYAFGNLVTNSYTDTSFFTSNADIKFNSKNNLCKSHFWSNKNSRWNKGISKSNCIIASNSNIDIKGKVRGSVYSRKGIKIATDKISGQKCENSNNCHAVKTENIAFWSNRCSSYNNGDYVINGSTRIKQDGCWKDLSISKDQTLTMKYTKAGYWFRNLSFESNARIKFDRIPEGETLTLNIDSISGNQLRAINFDNSNNAPHQVLIKLSGSSDLSISGRGELRLNLVAPRRKVLIKDNIHYYGGIRARGLELFDNARLDADESLIGLARADRMNFSFNRLGSLAKQ